MRTSSLIPSPPCHKMSAVEPSTLLEVEVLTIAGEKNDIQRPN